MEKEKPEKPPQPPVYRRKDANEAEQEAILEQLEGAGLTRLRSLAPTALGAPVPHSFEQSTQEMEAWLETRRDLRQRQAQEAKWMYGEAVREGDIETLLRKQDVLEWAVRHDLLRDLDERGNTFTLRSLERRFTEDEREAASPSGRLAGERLERYEMPLDAGGRYSNSPIRDMLILESNVAHGPLARFLFSKLHEEAFTPNVQRVLGVQYDANTGFLGRRGAAKLVFHAEALSREPSVLDFLTRDSELRARIGLPSEAQVAEHLGDDEYFVGDTETGRRVHDFFCNVMHQVLLTLAVLQEQASTMLVVLTLANLKIVDLRANNQATYGGSRLNKRVELEQPTAPTVPTSQGRRTRPTQPEAVRAVEPLVYRVGGREVRVPNLGFLVKFSFYDASSCKFDLTRYPAADGGGDVGPNSAPQRFPRASKFFLASVPDIWGETFSWTQFLIDLVLPLGVREYRGYYNALKFNPSLDLVLLLNEMRLESLWFMSKLALMRDHLDAETMLHLRYFGNLRRLEYKTVDESQLYNLLNKYPRAISRATVGGDRGVITGALLKPTTYTLLTVTRFLEHSLFDRAALVPRAETRTHYLFVRWFPLQPALTEALFGNLKRFSDDEMLDLSNVPKASGGIAQFRKWIFNDTYKLEQLFGDQLVLSSGLDAIGRNSAAFINAGSQGMIFRTKVTKSVRLKDGRTEQRQIPAALKSYKGVQVGLGASDGLINSNVLSSPEVVNELLISVIVSWLYETGRSPNFIETFSIFTMQYAKLSPKRSWREYLFGVDQAARDGTDNEVLLERARLSLRTLMEAFRERSFLFMELFLEMLMAEAEKAINTLPQGVTRGSHMTVKKSAVQHSFLQEQLDELRRETHLHMGGYASTLPLAMLLLTALRFYDLDVAESLELYVTSEKLFADEVVRDSVPERTYEPVQPQDTVTAADNDEARQEAGGGGEEAQAAADPPSDASESDLAQWFFTNDVVARVLAAFDVWAATAETTRRLQGLRQMANDEDVQTSGAKAYLITELIDGDMSHFRLFVARIQAGLIRSEHRPFNQVPSFDEYVTNALAQIALSLAIYHDYFHGMHADLHPGNIFLKYCDETTYYDGAPLSQHQFFEYEVRGTRYSVPNMGFVVKIADMGHATVSLGRDLAPVDGPDVELAPEDSINRRIVHKEVVNKDRKALRQSLQNIANWLSDKFRAKDWVLPSLNVADISDAVLRGEYIRDSGFFHEAFDLTTLFNNMQADNDLYSASLVSAWISLEKQCERERYGTEEFFQRYWPATYWSYWKGASVSIFLPRNTKNCVTPHLFIERCLGIYAADERPRREAMLRKLKEWDIYGSRLPSAPQPRARCYECERQAAIYDSQARLAFCSRVCQGETYLRRQLRAQPRDTRRAFAQRFLTTNGFAT